MPAVSDERAPSDAWKSLKKLTREKYFCGSKATSWEAVFTKIFPELFILILKKYSKLPLSDKYNIARLVGKINKTINKRDEMPTILFGPGRWGTTTPAMGVPVTFSEINNIAAIAEIAYKEGSLIPELSFGTHFFQDLVEMNIFYMAIYPDNEKVIFNTKWMQEELNLLEKLVPEDRKYADVVRVYDVRGKDLRLYSDVVAQEMICFFRNNDKSFSIHVYQSLFLLFLRKSLGLIPSLVILY